MIDQKRVEGLLSKVKRPGRYIGGEWNSLRKDLAGVDVKFALAFPDLYEIGMSHLGFKLLYHLLNEKDYIACERVFSPGADLEAILREEALPLFTLESREPLSGFDIIGFSLAYELNYTNVLNILDLSGIPLKTEERDAGSPLVIAGGPCSFNPEPMSDFIDLFIIGEAEDAVIELIDGFRQCRRDGISGRDLIRRLCRVDGVYAPSLYKALYEKDGRLREVKPLEAGVPPAIRKRTIFDLNRSFYPARQIVPFISIVHDRVSIEIMRGCPNSCKFCQARSIYYHKRERSLEEIMRLARESIKATGYEEVSLLSLSSGNHSQIIQIIRGLIDKFGHKGVNVSLPSLRIDKVLKEFPEFLSKIRKSGLTFAPEAGSERLRSAIGKHMEMDELTAAVEAACTFGWRRLKFYFMIGLPTETYDDIDKLTESIKRVLSVNRYIRINVSIAFFIPKPHTAFQEKIMEREEVLRDKVSYIRERIKSPRVRLKFHDTRQTLLEGIFSRGDRRLGSVILRAFKKGCRFDSWMEHLKFDAWMDAFKEEANDPSFYVYRERGPGEKFPWSHIETGAPK